MKLSSQARQPDAASSCEDNLCEVEECSESGIENEIIAVLFSEFERQTEGQTNDDSTLSTDAGIDDEADDERECDFADADSQQQRQRNQKRRQQQLHQAQEKQTQQQEQQEKHLQERQRELLQQAQQQQEAGGEVLSGIPLISDALLITWPRRPPSTLSRRYLKFIKGIYRRQKRRFLREHSKEEFKALKAHVRQAEAEKRMNIIKCKCKRPASNDERQEIFIEHTIGQHIADDACGPVCLPGCHGEHQRILVFIDK